MKKYFKNRETSAKRIFRRSTGVLFRLLSLILVMALFVQLPYIQADAASYSSIRVYYYFIDGTTRAHDPYVATFTVGDDVDLTITNPTVSGFDPVRLRDESIILNEGVYDSAAVAAALQDTANYASAPTIHVETQDIDADQTYYVYYAAGLSHYAARYYLQNKYDDLYTLDRDMTNANTDRLGYTGSAPDDLEAETIPGFTSLFHEPDAIAADGSTVFRVYYDRNYYTVNFDLGVGGYGVEPIYAKYETVYRVGDPTRMGYTFLGWARTSADSSEGAEGTDWVYIDPNAVILTKEEEVTEGGVTTKVKVDHYYADQEAYEAGTECTLTDITWTEAYATDSSRLLRFTDNNGDPIPQTIPFCSSYYKAIWASGTTHFSVVYWIENADSVMTNTAADFEHADGTPMTDEEIWSKISENYSAMCIREVYNIKQGNSYVPVTSGMTVYPTTVIRTRAKRARDEGINPDPTADPYEKNLQIKNLFSFNLGYADPDDPFNQLDTSLNPDQINYKKDSDGHIIDFPTISKGTSADLAGAGDFFEYNAPDDTTVDTNYRSDANMTVRGDGTSRFNIFFRRKTFTLKFYYARQGYTNGVLDPNKFSLTNSTKQFNDKSAEKEYLKTTSKNVLEAIAKGSWSPNLADSLPTVKDEYKQIVTEDYDDFVDKSGGYYRYYYYQVQAKYNEPLKDKWLIDALNTVHRKGAAENQICYPGSIATEYYNQYYQDRKSSGNFTVKGVYEKLDKGILFTDSARQTMKQNNIDYTELHFLISWTNTSSDNGWNSSITRVLHFRYENYVELLPREVEIVENNGTQALLAEGNYTDARQFTTKVKVNGSWVEKTKWYGLSTDHIYETIDSGDQYDAGKDKIKAARVNQTPTQMTGFEIEYYRAENGLITLDDYNTIVDWSQDTTNYRRCIIMFFYRRRQYTLTYVSGNRIEPDHTRTIMYDAPINSVYQTSVDGHEAGDYRYYWTDPEYFDEHLRDYYIFDGWYEDPRYEYPLDLDTARMPADDDVLYAKWTPKTIKVRFYEQYDNYYDDRKGTHPEKRVVLNQKAIADAIAAGTEVPDPVTELEVEYGTYIPNNMIPVDSDDPDIPRPRLQELTGQASFAGWYYMRSRVPQRFEPENMPITTLNEESGGTDPVLRLYAEWVTTAVAKYQVRYVKDSDPSVDVAEPTTGRAYVWKTKTFNAKTGDQLYDEYKWTAQHESEGTNWWPTANSTSMVIKANETEDGYEPNTKVITYIQKQSVHYKVQYLNAVNFQPFDPEHPYIEKESTNGVVAESAKIFPGYIAREASISLVLTASTNPDPEAQRAEELAENVITFLYDENHSEYLYEVEYLTQDVEGGMNFTTHLTETLTVPIAESGDTTISVADDIVPRQVVTDLAASGFERTADCAEYFITDSSGVTDTEHPVMLDDDDARITITGTDKKTIRIFFIRKAYHYIYKYVDHTAENEYLNTPAAQREGMWDGVLATFDDPADTGLVGAEIDIPDPYFYDYDDDSDPATDPVKYVRVANTDGSLTDVRLTIQPDDDNAGYNIVKVYYRLDSERELNYQMVCVNENGETDYYDDGTPMFGRLTFNLQTVHDYNAISPVTFFSTDNEKVMLGSREVDLHDHGYTFLGWYSTDQYDPDHPEVGRLTAASDTTLDKEDMDLDSALPETDVTYYALVMQNMVKIDVMFYYIDDMTKAQINAIPDADDDALSDRIQTAIDNENDASVTDKVYPAGDLANLDVIFTSPTGLHNHVEVPYHKSAGYTLYMNPKDDQVNKYEFCEWWAIGEDGQLVRKTNWTNADIRWSSDSLDRQLARNRDQYLVAVYTRRTDISELPYSIDYNFVPRTGGDPVTYTVTGTLTGDQLDDLTPGNTDCAITDSGNYELTDEFIMLNAPYESNYGETLQWTDAEGYIVKTSETAKDPVVDPDTGDVITPAIPNRIITTATARQEIRTVVAHYRTAPTGVYIDLPLTYGDNHKLAPAMEAIEAPETYNGLAFSYWAVRKSGSDSAPVIAKSFDTLFDLCMMDDYYISPVYEGAAAGPGSKSAVLSIGNLSPVGGEDWLAWTWNEGEEGLWVRPDSDLRFTGLKDLVIFVRVPAGTAISAIDWNTNVWNKTEDQTVQDGYTFILDNYYQDSSNRMYGEWSTEPAPAPAVSDDEDQSVVLTFLDYSRNRWGTEGSISADGSTDRLYADFEIAYIGWDERFRSSSDYQTGVFFEYCATIPENTAFVQGKDYNSYSDEANMKAAILTGSASGVYNYKDSKRRSYLNTVIPNENMTNHNRIEFAKSFLNNYREGGYPNNPNACYLFKVTAYLIDKTGENDTVAALSAPVYICLRDEAAKNLMINVDLGSIDNN